MGNKEVETGDQASGFVAPAEVKRNEAPATPTKEELITPPKPILKSTEKFKLSESTPEQPKLKSRISKLLEY